MPLLKKYILLTNFSELVKTANRLTTKNAELTTVDTVAMVLLKKHGLRQS